MFTDPIADMLTRVRNAAATKKAEVRIPYSKLKHSLAEVLKAEGYITDFRASEGTIKHLDITLKYDANGQTVISGIKRVSKPGQRIYASIDRIPRVNGGLGLSILSTSHGLMTDKEARKQKFGGEIICQVW
jgi:small subunit ribosomal protein S8